MSNEQSSLTLFYRNLKRFKVPSRAEQLKLIKKAQAGNDGAREKMINSNLRLVVVIAKNFQGIGLELPDLIQEGTLGLIRALEKFDPERNNAFSSYAKFWIIQCITRALTNKGRFIRLPVNINEKLLSFIKAKQELTEKLRREPTFEEIASRVKESPQCVKDILEIGHPLRSLDEPVGEDGESLQNFLSDSSPEDTIDKTQLDIEIDSLLKILSPDEKEIITLRFGLNGNGGVPKTLEEIGGAQRITRERVRQIEAKAIRKLRRHIARLGLKYEDMF